MPSAVTKDRARPTHDDLDNYDVGDLSDDPFRSPTPEASSKKRKEPADDVGIDEEVSVQKRARIPNVKLDEDRLLGAAGIPKLRTRATGLKIKGKGHEFSDAARLLSFYQLWLDDLFPKARFLDALTMVEKAGHKKKLMVARNEWIHESRRRDDDEANDEDDTFGDATEGAAQGDGEAGPSTPPARAAAVDDDVPGNDDLYGATPRANRPAAHPESTEDVPEEDDLAALMAEAESHDRPSKPHTVLPPTRDEEPDENDLEAMMAEAEAFDAGESTTQAQKTKDVPPETMDDHADDEEAMREMDGLW